MIDDVAAALRREAREVDERRALVLSGEHATCRDAVDDALDGAGVDRSRVAVVGREEIAGLRRVRPTRAGELLGTTLDAVVVDAHAELRPNALGQVVGTVDGGGLLVLLSPRLDEWPDRRDAFDRTLAVPPFDVEQVTGRFRRRFVETLRAHRGIAIVDVDEGRIEDDGLTHPAPRLPSSERQLPVDTTFPRVAYERCLTGDQVSALSALEALAEPGAAVVVEADRGRGKSSVAGLAAGSLAAAGNDVLVTAPEYRSAREVFARADELLVDVGMDVERDRGVTRRIDAGSGGMVRFLKPAAAVDEDPDVLVVDEAAAIAVPILTEFLDVDRVAFATTIHGYEGAGRGFSVRFRDRLARGEHDVTELTMSEPIRYAAGDPIEVWSFRALLLAASPPADELVGATTPETVEYRALEPDDLLADEPLLREAFGLLVLAHYRTEPNDLARLLDAPNVSTRALLHDGHVASVALLAREGNLSADRRADMYEGGRVKGNMVPDVLTSQLRDESAGELEGIRILRIATHAAVRGRGLGSRLLSEIRSEFGGEVDWLGAGFGATPDLVDFWAKNGYATVHLSTTRNESSGEHSVVVLSPTGDRGRTLARRHGDWFAKRIPGVLSDALRDADPDVVRAALRATDAAVEPVLSEPEWRHVAGMAYGPGLVDVDPAPFRRLATAHLIDPADRDVLSSREERLLVAKVLQARAWETVADALGFHSRGECMRAIGEAFKPLVDVYGTTAALEERERFR